MSETSSGREEPEGFLKEFFERSNAQNVYLIAHSLGNRALTRAVATFLAENPSLRTTAEGSHSCSARY